MNSRKYFTLTIMAILFSVSLLFAQAEPGDSYVTPENVSIQGYDVVTYFTQNEALRGSKKFASQYEGVHYWFRSAENKKMFEENPGKYIPQYGGWCAFAMGAKNAKVASDPQTFKIYNGKLYLFFNDYMQGEPFNTIIPWNADEQKAKQIADANWQAMNQ
jgi:YHS domain-containing protein